MLESLNLPELISAIEAWATSWNNDPKPFTWTATADTILGKVSLVEESTRSLTRH